MSVAERHLSASHVPDELANARALVHEGNFQGALQSIAQAKANDPRNIFLIALEKQVSRLKNGGILPRERTEIIDSLDSLFERAKSDGQTRVGMAAVSPAGETPDPAKKDPRLKLVVDQYFKHADEWIQRGDFEAAAKEIERVLLIDPENRIAKEYQGRIAQLLKEEKVPPVPEERPAPPRAQVRPAAPMPQPPAEAVLPAEKRSGWLWIVAGILLLGVVVAVVLFLRPYQPRYRPGLMYVVQSAAPAADEVQTNAPAVAENVPVVKEELSSASQTEGFSAAGSAEIVPPTSVKGTAKETEKTAVKGEAKTESRPVREEPNAEPLKKVAGIAPAVAAPIVSSEVAAKGESAAPVESAKPFIPVEEPPKIINLQQPVFSQEQVRAGIEGDVLVKVQIDQTGKPVQAKVVSSTNESLNAAVIDAVMRSTYSPAVMSNGPVTTWMSIPLKLK